MYLFLEERAVGASRVRQNWPVSQSSNLTVDEEEHQDLIRRVTGGQEEPTLQRRRAVEPEQSSEDEVEEVPPPSKRAKTNKSSRGAKSSSTRATRSKHSSKDLWTTIEYIWPAHERPPGLLQDRDWVNAQSYESISLMRKAGDLCLIIYVNLPAC